MQLKQTLQLGLLALLGWATQADALSITAKVGSLARGGTVNADFNGTKYSGVNAGQIKFANISNSMVATYGWCIEPSQDVYFGRSYTWNLQPLKDGSVPNYPNGMGTTRANQLHELLGHVQPDFNTLLSNTQALALQIAVWEIVDETSGTLDVTSGSVSFSNPSVGGNPLQLANSWLQQVSSGTITAKPTSVYAGTSQQYQDMAFQYSGTPATTQSGSVPAPPTLLLLLIPGLGLLASRSRYMKARRAAAA